MYKSITARVIGLAIVIGFFSSAVWATPVTEEKITGIAYGTSPAQARRMALSQIVYQINQKISYNRCQRSMAGTQTIDCTSLAYHFDFHFPE